MNMPQKPDLLTLWILGGAVQDMQKEAKKNIAAAILRGDDAEKLLVRCLPFLRSVEARALRTDVLTLLESSKNAALLEGNAMGKEKP